MGIPDKRCRAGHDRGRRVIARRQGASQLEAVAAIVLVACAGLFGMAGLGGGFRDAISDATPHPAALALASEAGTANLASAAVHEAEALRIPTLARRLRSAEYNRAWRPAMEVMGTTANWQPEVSRLLHPLGTHVRGLAMDWLRDVEALVGRADVNASYYYQGRHADDFLPGVALTEAFAHALPWKDLKPVDKDVSAQYFDAAARMLESHGRALPASFAKKRALVENLFRGGVTADDIRAAYGARATVVPPRHFLSRSFITRDLPVRGTPAWDVLVTRTREGLGRRGYVILPTSQYFSEPTATGVRRAYAAWSELQFDRTSGEGVRLDVRHSDYEHYPEELEALQGFTTWQTELLHDAFPADPWTANTALVSVRHENERRLLNSGEDSNRTRAEEKPVAHYDPVVVASSIALHGEGTIVYPSSRRPTASSWGPVRARDTSLVGIGAGTGDLLFFTGLDVKQSRALAKRRAMLHGSPSRGPARTFLAAGFVLKKTP